MVSIDITQYDFFKRLQSLPYVESIILFGSRARGDADEYSDIDLAITAPAATAEEWNTLTELLDNAPILEMLDVVRYDTLDDGLYKQQIDKYGKCLYVRS